MLAPHRTPPAGPLIGIAVHRHLARRKVRKPVRPLPAQLLAKTRPRRRQMRVQRRPARRALRPVLLRRPGDGVMLAISLQRPRPHPIGGKMHPAKAPDIHRPQIVRCRPLGHPFGQGHASPPGRGDAKGVEPRPHKEIRQLRRLAQNEIAIWRETLRPVQQLLHPRRLQRRHPRNRVLHELAVMIPIRGQQIEMKPLRYPLHRPWLGVRLVAAPDQPAHLFLPICQPVRVAQRRQICRHPRNFLGDHVLMLDRDQRHIHPHRSRQHPAPLPGATHHLFAFDDALRRLHPANTPGFNDDADHRRILEYLHPRRPRAPRQALGDVRRVGLPVGRQERRPHQIVDGHQRPHVLRLLRGQQMHLQPERMRGCRLPLHLGPAVLIARQPQTAIHLPAGLQARLRLQPLVKIHRITQQLRDVGGCPQLPHQPRRMKRGARGQLVALQQNRVAPPQFPHVIGNRAANDAAPDDDNARGGG